MPGRMVCRSLCTPCQLLGQLLTVIDLCAGGSFQRARHSRTTGLSLTLVMFVIGQ